MPKKKLSLLQQLVAKHSKPAVKPDTEDNKDTTISQSPVDGIMNLLDNTNSGDNAPAEFKTSFDLESLIKSVGTTNFLNNISTDDLSEGVQNEINAGIRVALVSVSKAMHGSFQEDLQSFYDSKSGERQSTTQTLLDTNSMDVDDDPVFGTVGKLLQEQLRTKFPRATSKEINSAVREELETHKESFINKANSDTASDSDDTDGIPSDEIDWADALGVTFDDSDSKAGEEGAET